MWESPIKQIADDIDMAMEGEIMRVVKRYGFDVDKEELTKALAYDRGQYDKGYDDGYADGYAKAIAELKQRFRNEYEEMMELEMEDCINWADWLDATAEQILADGKKG